MNRRSRRTQLFVGALLAGAGGAFAAFRNARNLRAEPPINALGGARRGLRFRGHELFVTELGSGPPLFLFHGVYAGASSYEFRKIAPLLARGHRVIAIDFLGCGLSDRPNIAYTAELFIEQITRVVEACATDADEPALLVGGSLAAAFALRAASRMESRVRGVVAIEPTGLEDAVGLPRRAIETVMRLPILGEACFAGLTSAASLRYFLRRVYSSERFVTPEVVAHYEAVAGVPGARYVTAAFIGGELACDLASDLPFIELPVLIVRGGRSRIGPSDARLREYAALGRAVRVRDYPDSGALVHEERPDALAADIETFAREAAGTAV